MKYYAGLDVSLNSTTICIMNENRKVILEGETLSEPKAIQEYLKATNRVLELVGLESGFISHWLYTELMKIEPEMPLKCIDARKVSAALSNNINKTDRCDAKGIADIMRAGFYSEVHIKSANAMEVGSCLQSRATLVSSIVALKGSLRGQMRCYGVKLKANKTGFVSAVAEALKTLNPELAACLNILLQSFTVLQTNLEVLDKRLLALAKADDRVALLETVPGVGPITALAFISEVDDPKRFKNSRDVAAYFGLTPRQYASGETRVQLGISKQGSSMMRALLVGAAMSHQRSKSWSKAKAWSLKLKRKHGPRKARVALARKLCTVMNRMLVTGEIFKLSEMSAKEALSLQNDLRSDKPKKKKKVA